MLDEQELSAGPQDARDLGERPIGLLDGAQNHG